MNKSSRQELGSREQFATGRSWPWLLIAACVLLVLVEFLRNQGHQNETAQATDTVSESRNAPIRLSRAEHDHQPPRQASPGIASALTAEEIVAGKLTQFSRNRRELIHAIAK